MAINVARVLNREKANFSVDVLTPMFLGGASGNAELRSPPFKNAIRYWWRISQGDIPHEELLKKERELFGGVGEANKTNQSLVDVVVTGDVKTGKIDDKISFGKKKNPEASGRDVELSAYLGMGPVHFDGKCKKTWILPKETFSLSVLFPKKQETNMIAVFSLFKEFGALGARSRNGFGSFELTPVNGGSELMPRKALVEKYGEEIRLIFEKHKKYPFRLGIQNEKPLIWLIGSGNRWQDAMESAGRSYMDLRQQVFPFPGKKPAGVEMRHILGYPVTNHSLKTWGGNNGRMPSQLRILIRKKGDTFKSYFFHLPHKIAKPWNSQLGEEGSVWKKMHQHLDKSFERVSD